MKKKIMYVYFLSGGCLSVTKETWSTVSNLRQVMNDYGADYGRKENEDGTVLAIARRNERGKIIYTLHR